MTTINIYKVLDFMRDSAPKYAKAKAERIYIEEMRKSKKAMLMKKAEVAGFTSAAAQEREAYADPEYMALLEGLKAAVEIEETLRWQLVSAEAKAQVWKSLEYSNGRFDKAVE